MRVALLSLGKLNGLILQLLARTPEVREIVVGTRSVARAEPALHLALVSAGAGGFFPAIRAVELDPGRPEAAAEALRSLEPDVTFAAPSLRSWWVLEQAPPEAAARLRPAGFGAWLPFQLAPMIRLMRAFKASGLATPIVSAPYPDAVNPVLASRGLAPTCGAGNLDEIVPKLRLRIAAECAVRPEEVRVWLAAHHALERFAYRRTPAREAPPPYLLRVEVSGRKLGPDADLTAMLLEPYPLPAGLDFHFLTAGSALRLVTALAGARAEPVFLHCPGPHGLPGGYPVAVRDGAVALDLPSDWDREEAVRVNRESHRWDGIESIDETGNVTLTEESAAVLREVLDFRSNVFRFEEVEAVAEELRRRFDEYVARTNA